MEHDGRPVAASLELRTAEAQPEEEADSMTRHLLNELRASGVGADLVRSEHAAPGTKSAEVQEIGKLALSVLPVALPYLSGVLHEWLGRKTGRSIKLKTPNGFELEATGGMSTAEIEKLVTALGGVAKSAS